MSHIHSLPFDVLFMVMGLLPVRDRVRASRTSRKFHEAVASTWSKEKAIPVDLNPISDSALVRLITKFSHLQVFDMDLLTHGAQDLLIAEILALKCPRIVSFKSVQLHHLSLVSQYVRSLRLPASDIRVQSIDLQFQDWQVHTPHLYQHLSYIFATCGQLQEIRLENDSYGHLYPDLVWLLIGSRITSLEISCPYISVMGVFRPGPTLRRVVSSFTQSDFNYLCHNCPLLQVLDETTFFREALPDHEAVVSVQSDPASDSDLILDMRPLMLLKHIHTLTLTSLISPQSLVHLKSFLCARGSGLQILDLNLSQGPAEDVVSAVFNNCPRLQRVTLFFTCRSGGPGVSELSEMVHKFAVKSAAKVVLVFRHEGKTIRMPALPSL